MKEEVIKSLSLQTNTRVSYESHKKLVVLTFHVVYSATNSYPPSDRWWLNIGK
jgi:hypothetical protein